MKFFSKLSWIFLVPKLPLNLSSLIKVLNYFHEKWLRLLIQNLLTRCMIGIMDHTVFVAWFDLQGTISSFCMLFSVWKTLYNGILFLLLIRCIYKVGSLIGCKWNLQIFFPLYFRVQDINLINYLFCQMQITLLKKYLIIIKLNVFR